MFKIKKWFYQSLVDDFYKGNNGDLIFIALWWTSILISLGVKWIFILIFLLIVIIFTNLYFNKGRELYLILFQDKIEQLYHKKYKGSRVSLNMEDFEKLVSGKIIQKGQTKILLQDIGYLQMIDILEKKLKHL